MSQNQINNFIKIESIKKLKKIGYYSLITNKETISVTDDIIVKYALLKDKEITLDEFEIIKNENDKHNYYLKACHYIYYQMRSLKEVEEYLLKYQLDEKDIDDIINRLKDLQLIDDNLLCSLILEKTISTLKGPNAFLNKVKQRRLQVNLNEYKYPQDIEEEVIDKVIEKNLQKKSNLPVKKQKEQLYSKLIRDGFSNELVNSHIQRIEFIDESLETLDKEFEKLMRKHQGLDDKVKKQKILVSLSNKGFSYNQVISKINSIDSND